MTTHNRSKHLLRVSSGRSDSSYIVVQLLSHVWLFGTKWTAARQASLSFSLLEFVQAHVYWVGDAIQPSHPLSPSSPPAFNLSPHRGLFQWVGWLLASGGPSVGASPLVPPSPWGFRLVSSGLAGWQQSWNVFIVTALWFDSSVSLTNIFWVSACAGNSMISKICNRFSFCWSTFLIYTLIS